MIIPPNSEFIMLTGVPLDSTYKNTIEFDNKLLQENYFRSKAFYSFGTENAYGISSEQTFSFIRDSQAVKVPLPIAKASICNYVMYRNTLYYDRWFYAFVTKIEYISDETTRLELETDVMQTYHFDYILQSSFVERMHEADDTLINIVEEGLETGPLFCQNCTNGNLYSEGTNVMIASTADVTKTDLPAVDGQLVNGIYCGAALARADTTESGIKSVNATITKLTNANKADAIVALYMIPKKMLTIDNTIINVPFNKTFGSYVPVNNKLTRYPYNFISITNTDGQEGIFKYELFTGGSANFKFRSTPTPPASVTLIPQNYNGIGENVDERLTITNFPQCAYNIDAFAAYLALNQNQLAYQTGKHIGQVFLGAVTGDTEKAAQGMDGIFSELAKQADIETLPPQSRGTYNSDVLFSSGQKDFQIKQFRLTPEYAFIIDQFFSVFGYRQNKFFTPNKKARPYYTYIKTRNMSVYGQVPQDYVTKINNIFDKGVTFWRNTGDIIGNYDLARANNPGTYWPTETGG